MSYHRRYVRKKNRRKERIKIIIIVGVVVFSLLIGLLVGLLIIDSNNEDNSATPDSAIPVSTNKIETTEKPSVSKQETTNNEKETSIQSTEDIDNIEDENKEKAVKNSIEVLKDIGVEAEDFDFEQLVVVQSNGTSANISFFEKRKGMWKYSKELETVNGFVGAQGVSSLASEYTEYTPSGLYSLGTAFGICDNPGTKLDYFNVTSNSYWVDDPNSGYYNQHVEGTENADWKSAEHLIEANPAYNYAVFIEYNTNPTIPGKGSAFFMHVGYEPTAGCVSMAEDSMISLLRWLDPEKSPHVLIM